MSKTAIIVHCWGGKPDYCWYPWVKNQLEEKGFSVLVPSFPDTDMPKMKRWLRHLREAVGAPNRETVLIGHSLGVITIFRYLEELEKNYEVGGVVGVAGFTDDLSYLDSVDDELKNFFTKPILWEKIKSHTKNFVMIHSDNDPYISLRYGDIFKKKLGAEVVIKKEMGHFSGEVDDEESCTQLQDVVDAVLKCVV